MTELQFTIAYLKAIEQKHEDYFSENHTTIMQFVDIIGTKIVSVEITNKSLPPEIRYDIEEMFWVH
jgi:hypothetical protein